MSVPMLDTDLSCKVYTSLLNPVVEIGVVNVYATRMRCHIYGIFLYEKVGIFNLYEVQQFIHNQYFHYVVDCDF